MSVKSLFLDNNSVRQTIFKNTFWLALGTAINKFLLLVLLIYVARILGATQYGMFTFALSFVSLFIIFSNMGLSQIIVREFSFEEKRKEFYSVISLRFFLSIGAFILIWIGSFFITQDETIRNLIWVLGGFAMISGISSLFYDFFQARQKMELQSLGVVLEALLISVLGFIVIFNFPSVLNLSYAYFIASITALFLILIIFHFNVFPLNILWDKEIWKRFILMSWPLALTALFSTLYNYIDSVMMGHLNQITQTGWYNAAYRIANLTLLPMGFVVSSFYPALSKFYKESKEKIQKSWDSQMKLITFLAIPMVVGGIILAPKIIETVYGQAFEPSVFAFQILIIMAAVIFFHYPLNYILVVFNKQKSIFWIAFTGVLINIALNIFLIPKYSLYGAAVATLITNVFIFIFYYMLISKQAILKVFDSRFFSNFILSLVSGAVMYFVIVHPFIYSLNVFISVFVGAISYSIALYLLLWISNSI